MSVNVIEPAPSEIPTATPLASTNAKPVGTLDIVTATIDSDPSASFVENTKPSLILVTLSSTPFRDKLLASVKVGIFATGDTVNVKSPPSGSLILAPISFDWILISTLIFPLELFSE